jgi:glycosyltransferase involved in cell wall biosynthesis
MNPDTNNSVSMAIFAWNEAGCIGPMLESLFRQSLFSELRRRNLHCEVLCVVNGCTDQTPELAAELFARQSREHPDREFFSCRVVNLPERGKLNAWNRYVHEFSAREAGVLFMMDADIIIHRLETLWLMWQALETEPQASVAVDRPCKDIWFKPHPSFSDRISLAMSQLTGSAPGQLCGQLYAIRATVARNIYLPRDLAACEDGFIKAMACTDSLTRPIWSERIRFAQGAEHAFEAYISPLAILRNQKRQMIGQTIVHLLVDKYLATLPLNKRKRLADTLRQKEAADPPWLKRLIGEHLHRTPYFWKLYPGLLTERLRHWSRLRGWKRWSCAPAVGASFLVSLLASFLAWRALKTGTMNYWPKAPRRVSGAATLKPKSPETPAEAQALGFSPSAPSHT